MAPIHEAIVDTVIPHTVPAPIPVRTVTTRSPKPPMTQAMEATPEATRVRDQADTLREKAVGADSPASEESVKLSPQLTALARKEQAYRLREQALKTREKELEAKLADADKFSQLKAKFAAKDYSEAEALGLDYEGHTAYLLAKQNGEKPEDQKVKTLEEKLAALEKRQEESQAALFEATVSEYRTEISKFVETHADYSGLKDPETQKAVLQVILDAFEKDGEELSIEEAAKDVKAYLSAQAKKLEPFLERKTETVVEEKRTLPPPSRTSLKTLTQQVTAGANSVAPKSLQHLPEAERYAEAYRRAQARLKAQQGQ